LSSSNFPNEISRIELGLDGFCSHSTSKKISDSSIVFTI
jgi:hypothetical protein